MGVIRTQELLAARKIDGGEQFFTRAIDFGFTKSADETLSDKWPRDKVLGDVVWNIRRFRPDVIILRFTGTPRDGHGHHQSSAILGREAFAAAADPARFPEQLQYVQPWQAKRLLMNVATFTSQQEKEALATPGRLEVDLGEYSPELGLSYGEIAGMSRSQHRSQGMGSAERKGSQKNYLLTLAGDTATKDPFEGVDISWARLKGGAEIGSQIGQALQVFVPAHPEELLPRLAKVRPLIAAIDDPLARRKLKELDELMALCAGLSVEAQADKFSVTPGGSLKVNFTATLRSTCSCHADWNPSGRYGGSAQPSTWPPRFWSIISPASIQPRYGSPAAALLGSLLAGTSERRRDVLGGGPSQHRQRRQRAAAGSGLQTQTGWR